MSSKTSCGDEIVKSGEVCTIEVAEYYGIFDDKTYFNSNISENDKLKIDKHISNTIDNSLPYSLCSLKPDNNTAVKNCALVNKNPWLTYNGHTSCSLPDKIELPPGLEFNENNEIIRPSPIFRYKSMKGYCQEKWTDWFVIPDYHLGNRYMVYNEPERKRNILACYKPCKIEFIPVNNYNDQDIGKCISKNLFEGGLYKGTFYYLPIALILLLGSTKNDLLKIHKSLFKDIKDTIINNDLILEEELYNYINENNNIINPINSIIDENIREIKLAIKELFKLSFDYNNIIVPDKNVIEMSKNIITKYRILNAYNIAKNFHNIINDPTKTTEYEKWKDDLCIVNGYSKGSKEFKKLLLILKKACNITFNGKSDYSSKYMLYTLNKNKEDNEVEFSPFEFIISDIEKQYIDITIYKEDIKAVRDASDACKKYKETAIVSFNKIKDTIAVNAEFISECEKFIENCNRAYNKSIVATNIIKKLNPNYQVYDNNKFLTMEKNIKKIEPKLLIIEPDIKTIKDECVIIKENLVNAESSLLTYVDNQLGIIERLNGGGGGDGGGGGGDGGGGDGGGGGGGGGEGEQKINKTTDYINKETNILPFLNKFEKYYSFYDDFRYFIYIFVLIFIIYILYIIYVIFSPYINGTLNYIILYFINIGLYSKDLLFKLFNKYYPYEYAKNLSEVEYYNADNNVSKINKSIMKNKILES